MHKGQIFCFRVKAGVPVPFGPLHKDLTQAKVWAKSQPIALGDVIGYAEVRLVTVAESTGFALREVEDYGGLSWISAAAGAVLHPLSADPANAPEAAPDVDAAPPHDTEAL